MEQTRTGPHRQAERYLDKLHISYISECQDFGNKSLDLYLPEFHVCVEIDGPGHTRKSDRERDVFLEERYFIPTLRIKAEGLNGDNFQRRFVPFLEKWASTAEPRKFQMRAGNAKS